MALIVETGLGSSAAESYASIQYADAFHTARGREDTWTDLDIEVKEQALRNATDFLTQRYRMRWLGYRVKLNQALDWPRYDVPKPDVGTGYGKAYYATNEIPEEVKKACAELALRATTGPLTQDEGPKKIAASVGPISVTYAEGTRQNIKYTSVDEMLAPLLTGGGDSFVSVERC